MTIQTAGKNAIMIHLFHIGANKIKVLTFRRLFEYGNLNSCLCAKTHKSIGNFKEAIL